MLKYFLFLFLLSFQLTIAQTLYKSEPIVRVRIINSVDTLKITFNHKWDLLYNLNSKITFAESDEACFYISGGRINATKDGKQAFEEIESFVLKSTEEKGTLKIKNVPYGVGWWWENKEDRVYEGEIRFYATRENKFVVIIHLPLEQYLKGVVPYEIGNNSPLEATKAQAVAARSESIMGLNSKLYRGEHYDLTSDVECQVFSGNIKRTENSDRAVEETKSLILSENEKPINAYYASNCGGHSELIKNVWGDRPGMESYRVSGFDSEETDSIDLSDESNLRKWLFLNPPSYCNPNVYSDLPTWSQNNFRWKVELTTDAVSKMASKGKDLGSLTDIKILNRGESGRAYLAKFVFEKETVEVKGELKIRQMFGPPLRSACFVVDKTEAGFIFYGAGWGHGVGMCQSGAITMAKKGTSFEDILKHYYKKTELMKIF